MYFKNEIKNNLSKTRGGTSHRCLNNNNNSNSNPFPKLQGRFSMEQTYNNTVNPPD